MVAAADAAERAFAPWHARVARGMGAVYDPSEAGLRRDLVDLPGVPFDRETVTMKLTELANGYTPSFIRTTPETVTNGPVRTAEIPLSFAGILGGICTYIGTSTNIIVGSILEEQGYEPFRMFEFTRLGGLFLVLGIAYLLLLGRKLLPSRRTQEDLTAGYHLREYLTELVIEPRSRLIGKTLKESNLSQANDIEVLEIRRNKERLGSLLPEIVLVAGDLLIVKGNIDNIMRAREGEGVAIHPGVKFRDEDLQSPDVVLAECVISARSSAVRCSCVSRKNTTLWLRRTSTATFSPISPPNCPVHWDLRARSTPMPKPVFAVPKHNTDQPRISRARTLQIRRRSSCPLP